MNLNINTDSTEKKVTFGDILPRKDSNNGVESIRNDYIS